MPELSISESLRVIWQIDPWLWVSGYPANRWDELNDLGIHRIVNLCPRPDRLKIRTLFDYHHVPLIDGDFFEQEDQVVKGVRTVRETYSIGVPTLVHCAGGMNRSVLVAMTCLDVKGEAAVEYMRQTRPGCLTNANAVKWYLERGQYVCT